MGGEEWTASKEEICTGINCKERPILKDGEMIIRYDKIRKV